MILFIFLLMVTESLPLTWDEGDAFKRADKISQWFALLIIPSQEAPDSPLSAGTESPFSRLSIQKHWFHTTRIEGHPAGYTLLISAGRGISRLAHLDFLSEKVKYRLGTILFFSLAMGAVFYRMRRDFGIAAACFSVLAILCLPRIFAHAQIAACDSPLMASWLLVWALFESGLRSKRGAVLWGIALGLGFSMKFPGWIIPIPYIFFFLICIGWKIKISGQWRLVALGIPIALLTFYILNPNIWHAPVTGFARFVHLNTNRSAMDVSICFLGTNYNLERPLPWYNTLIWTGITIPLGLLLLGFFTIGRETARCFDSLKTMNENGWHQNNDQHPTDNISRSDENGMTTSLRVLLLTLNFLALIVVRAIPGLPVHDGVRLFVAAFPFWGILAGIGAAQLWTRGKDWSWNRRRRFASRMVVVTVFLCSIFNLYWYAPQWLSYYNFCIGGLKGAVAAGMEPTYYCDALDQEVLDWLNTHTDFEGKKTGNNEKILFVVFSTSVIRLDREWGLLGTALVINTDEVVSDHYRWYVFQHRGNREYQKLQMQYRPAYQKFIRRGGIGPWNLGETAILSIYDSEDFP